MVGIVHGIVMQWLDLPCPGRAGPASGIATAPQALRTEGHGLAARHVDHGDHIEFGLQLERPGVDNNPVSAVLLREGGDLRINSDVRPDLNGRMRLRS